MSVALKVQAELKVRSVERLLLEMRAQCAMEWCVNLGGSEADAATAGKGILAQAWKEIRIDGLDPVTGCIHDRAVYRMEWRGNERRLVMIEDNDDKTMLERLDGGLGILVRRAAERFRRKGLLLETTFVWTDGMSEADKDLLRRQLGVEPAPQRPWAGEPRCVAQLSPRGKDPGATFELWWRRTRLPDGKEQ